MIEKLNIKISGRTKRSGQHPETFNLINIHRTLHPKNAKYKFFSSSHGTYTKRDNVLSHKASHNNFIALKSHKVYPLTTIVFDF